MQLNDGSILESGDADLNGAVHFFQQLLTTSPVCPTDQVMSLLTPIISKYDSLLLCRIPILKEIKEAFWSIPQDSSPGLDDFLASFFQRAWDIIKEDLLKVAIDFF